MLTLEELLARPFAILGYGSEGRALAQLIRQLAPTVPLTVFAEQAPDDAQPLQPGQDQLHVGPLDAAVLRNYSVLVKSPGISRYHPALAALPETILQTSTTNLWFAEHGGERCLCITGTKGKSTTAALTAHLLSQAGRTVTLAGNIGAPLIEQWPSQSDWQVIELSSYQTADLDAHPEVGVLLSLYPEHLDWHGGESQYYADKCRLLTQADHAWAPPALRPRLAAMDDRYQGLNWLDSQPPLRLAEHAIHSGDQALMPIADLPLRGRHNASNVIAAWELARYAGIDDETIMAALPSFQPLAHRLCDIGQAQGLRFIDDSISTTPHAAIAALAAYADCQPLTILVGGHDRGLSWQIFADHLNQQPTHAVITMGANGARIHQLLRDNAIHLPGGIHNCASLDEAVATARRITPAGGTVLLSPGAPSYGEFKNYVQRGRHFAGIALRGG
ncbi:MAG: UDP-N-acetylmuramoyl-L-alanine--D-glutamate ligase [Wenzhouxiangellaceae bacterium]